MNPKGQHLFEIYTTLSYVRVASYTSHTLPCLNTKQVAVKVISKDQQPLVKVFLIQTELCILGRFRYVAFYYVALYFLNQVITSISAWFLY